MFTCKWRFDPKEHPLFLEWNLLDSLLFEIMLRISFKFDRRKGGFVKLFVEDGVMMMRHKNTLESIHTNLSILLQNKPTM